jgi:threonine/homoserine/homoserine lactone efflux protein
MISMEFLITSFIVVVMPGTGVIYTISTGLIRGTRAGVFAATGCTAGIIPSLLACILGVAVIIHTSALADRARTWIVASPGKIRHVQRTFAVMFAVLGARLAFSGR